MSEFNVGDDGPFKTAVGAEFALVVSTYGEVSLSKTKGGVDYLGQSVKPQPKGLCGASKEVVLKFKGHNRGKMEIGIEIGGTNYETNMPVETQEKIVEVIAA